jgi:hypothetical protein
LIIKLDTLLPLHPSEIQRRLKRPGVVRCLVQTQGRLSVQEYKTEDLRKHVEFELWLKVR